MPNPNYIPQEALDKHRKNLRLRANWENVTKCLYDHLGLRWHDTQGLQAMDAGNLSSALASDHRSAISGDKMLDDIDDQIAAARIAYPEIDQALSLASMATPTP